MMFDALISILAGLALFFIGVKHVTVTMGELTGRSLRRWVIRSTGHPVMRAALGALSGTLTQSTNAVTVILSSLVKADMITIPEATPLLAWSNVGTVPLVLVASIDIHLFVLSLISITGVCFYLNLHRSARFRPLVAVLFALGMLFLGLELMRQGSGELHQISWMRGFLIGATHSLPSALLAGVIFALVVQSSAAVTVTMIAMVSAGLVTGPQAAIVVLSANVSSGLGTYMMGIKVPGRGRQLPAYQAIFKIGGTLLLLPFYLIAQCSPAIRQTLNTIEPHPAQSIALIYLGCQLGAPIVERVLRSRLQPMLERMLPPSVEENLAQPHYLYDGAASEPETALTLVDKEQSRMFTLLPSYIGVIDHLEDGTHVPQPDAIFTAASMLDRIVSEFLNDMTDACASRQLLERIADRKSCNALLLSLHETMNELATALTKPFAAPSLKSLVENIREGLGALLLTAEEAVRTRVADDVDVLRQLTSDRSALVNGMRQRVMASDQALSIGDQAHLYNITNLLERIVWMLRRYAGLLADHVQHADEIVSVTDRILPRSDVASTALVIEPS
jgi:phosphate:Na+ symporter